MTMPSEAKYQALLNTLRYNAKSFDAAESDMDRLTAGIEALQAVVIYLISDAAVAGDLLTRPLAGVESAVFNARRGATVPLLEHAPERPGKPTGTRREEVQGAVAFALQLRAASGMGTDRAADWVASVAWKAGLRCEDGARIIAAQVKNWRAEIQRGKAPAKACATFEENRRYAPELTRRAGEYVKAGAMRARGAKSYPEPRRHCPPVRP